MKELEKTAPFSIYFGARLHEFAPAWLQTQYPQVQDFVTLDTGVFMPDLEIQLHRGLEPDAYLLLIHDEVAGCGSLGLAVLEDFYPELLDKIEMAMRRRAYDFLNLRGVQQRIRRCDSMLVDLLLKEASLVQLRWLLIELARERVTLRNLDRILELILEQLMHTRDLEKVLEGLRVRLAGTICRPLERLERVTVIAPGPAAEKSLLENGEWDTVRLEKLEIALAELRAEHLPEVLLVPAPVRKRLRQSLETRFPDLYVLSPAELRRGLTVAVQARLD